MYGSDAGCSTTFAAYDRPMVSAFRYHEISEVGHRILNPFTEAKIMQVGEIVGVGPDTTILDLACGKGELLCRYAERFGCSGVGVDIYPPYVEGARARAEEVGVAGRVRFVEGDAAHPEVEATFSLVSCIGATWIGDGLEGTLALMDKFLAPSGTVLVGEPYWNELPPEHASQDRDGEEFADLGGTLDRIEDAGFELVEMVLASLDDWDRYRASQWMAVADWLAANPDDPEADAMREHRDSDRRRYMAEERRSLGWGVFVLRRAA